MGNNKAATEERAYVGLEPGLHLANRAPHVCDKREIHKTRIIVENVVKKIIEAMKKQSPSFAHLHKHNFGGGSVYEGLKVGRAEEFDIDILLKLPEVTKPELKEDTIPGFVQLKLKNFAALSKSDPVLYSNMKTSFIQSIFDKTVNNYFPDNVVKVGKAKYEILKVQHKGPALTLTIKGPGLSGSIDLVPCILLTTEHWPRGGFRTNPYPKFKDFFIVAKEPKTPHSHVERYWRLSFQIQERKIIFNRFFMKPTIRILKLMRDHFKHKVSSYAIKTLFIWELFGENPALDVFTPDLWTKKPSSYCVIYMLEKYLKCLEQGEIWYFWIHHKKLNLLHNLTKQQIEHYKEDVAKMLQDIKKNPTSATLLSYLN